MSKRPPAYFGKYVFNPNAYVFKYARLFKHEPFFLGNTEYTVECCLHDKDANIRCFYSWDLGEVPHAEAQNTLNKVAHMFD